MRPQEAVPLTGPAQDRHERGAVAGLVADFDAGIAFGQRALLALAGMEDEGHVFLAQIVRHG